MRWLLYIWLCANVFKESVCVQPGLVTGSDCTTYDHHEAIRVVPVNIPQFTYGNKAVFDDDGIRVGFNACDKVNGALALRLLRLFVGVPNKPRHVGSSSDWGDTKESCANPLLVGDNSADFADTDFKLHSFDIASGIDAHRLFGVDMIQATVVVAGLVLGFRGWSNQ